MKINKLFILTTLLILGCGGGGGGSSTVEAVLNTGGTGGTGGTVVELDSSVAEVISGQINTSQPMQDNIEDNQESVIPVIFSNQIFQISNYQHVVSTNTSRIFDFIGIQSNQLGGNGIAIYNSTGLPRVDGGKYYEYSGSNNSYTLPSTINTRASTEDYSDVSNSNVTLLLEGSAWGFSGTINDQSESLKINEPEYILISNPSNSLLDYNTYGFWKEDIFNQSNYNTSVFFFTVGSKTDASAIPVNGEANYSGEAIGLYLSQSGSVFHTLAEANLKANFSSQTIVFSLLNTLIFDYGSVFENGQSNALLDINGMTLSYENENFISGSSCVGTLCGQVEAFFYGPSANEIGGLFNFNAFHGSYLGSFGTSQ